MSPHLGDVSAATTCICSCNQRGPFQCQAFSARRVGDGRIPAASRQPFPGCTGPGPPAVGVPLAQHHLAPVILQGSLTVKISKTYEDRSRRQDKWRVASSCLGYSLDLCTMSSSMSHRATQASNGSNMAFAIAGSSCEACIINRKTGVVQARLRPAVC